MHQEEGITGASRFNAKFNDQNSNPMGTKRSRVPPITLQQSFASMEAKHMKKAWADYNHSFRLDWLHSSSSLSRRLSRHLHLQQQIHQHSQHQYISAANQEIKAGDKSFRTSDLQQQSMMMGPSKGNHIANIPKYPAVPSLCRNVLLLYSPSNNSLNCKSAIHLR
nr:hypothetical protein Iba_chr12bCG10330 [Ipomoea batatas]